MGYSHEEAMMDGLPWWTSLFLLVLVAVFVAVLVLQIWAIVDAATVPSARWRQLGHRKAIWLVLIWFSSGIAAAYYGLRLRARLRANPPLDS
jgi:hypothetical protein